MKTEVQQGLDDQPDGPDVCRHLRAVDAHGQQLFYGLAPQLGVLDILGDAHKYLPEDEGEGRGALLLPGIDELEALVAFFCNGAALELALNEKADDDVYLLIAHNGRYLLGDL